MLATRGCDEVIVGRSVVVGWWVGGEVVMLGRGVSFLAIISALLVVGRASKSVEEPVDSG